VKASDFLKPGARRPLRTVLLEPGSFASSWNGRPEGAIAIGLRAISESDETTAAGEAEKFVRELVRPTDAGEAVIAYNDALMRWLVSAAMCDPNDAEKRHPDFPLAETTLHNQLTSNALRFLYEETERLRVETSPLHPPATDEEIGELIAVLSVGEAMSALPGPDAAVVRRFLLFALEELREVIPEAEAVSE